MKKYILNLLILTMGFFAFSNPQKQVILAETTSISNTVTIVSDTIINDDINISVLGADAYIINSGATLTINNSTISGDGNEDITNIFKVLSGGKLILNSVSFDTSINANVGIYNQGNIEINNTNIVSNITTSIYNDSTKEHSLIIYSGSAPKITLNNGYISVTESTTLSSKTLVKVTSELDNKLIVKGYGENVFANKLIDRFVINPSDKSLFLDYVGDACEATNSDGYTLNQGDIILTKLSLTTKDGTEFAGNYCTGNYFLNNFATENGYYPIYKKLKPLMIMNNYYCNNSEETIKYTLESATNTINLTVNTFILGNSTPLTTKTYSYPSGSNHAIFVDYPGSNYTLNSTEISDNNLEVSDELYANNYYMRPIIEYTPGVGTYNDVDAEINFVFEENQPQANLEITKKNNVNITYDNNLVVGNSHTFVIDKSTDFNITKVKFNNEEITLTENTNNYSFSVILLENNTIVIESKTLITITPDSFNFTYGDEILLTQEYHVDSTNEDIIITFVPNINTDVGTYAITQATTLDDYIITIASGEYFYTIEPKEVSISEVITKNHQTTYSEDLIITIDMFIESIPNYLRASLLFDNKDIIANEQDVEIQINIADNNYALIETDNVITAKLTVTPKEINTNNYSLGNLEATYDGNKKEVIVNNIDQDLVNATIEYYLITLDNTTLVSSAINSGRYYVKATLSSKSLLYTTNTILEDYLVINKCTIDLTEYKSLVQTISAEYNKEAHYLDTKETSLPLGVTILSVDNNIGHINVNEYNITINLTFDTKNYNCESAITCNLNITPKPITISLSVDSFKYNGYLPTLETLESGVIDGDAVIVTLERPISADAGKYSVQILGLDNANYYASNSELNYEITKATIDIASQITYSDIDVEYDGKKHLPIISGTLPLGVSYAIDKNAPCTNVGIYYVKCSFTVENDNYNTPNDIYARVNITPKSITIGFTQPNNMIANGGRKYLEISFFGLVDGEELKESIDYFVNYSGDCILAGEYSCTVSLPSTSNYKIINSNKTDFIIFAGSASYVSDDLTLTLEGRFMPDTEIIVDNTSNNINIINAIADKDFESYSSYKFKYQNYSLDPVTVKIQNKNSFNAENLTIYRIVNDNLEEIDFKISNNVITFQIQGNEEILFIESKSSFGNIILITVIILIAAAGIGTLTGYIVLKNKKKKNNK